MDIKESLSNVVSWAKSHPWLAGGVVLVVVLLAWFISKQTRQTGGMEVESDAPPDILGGSAGGGGLFDNIPAVSIPETESPPSLPSLPVVSMESPSLLESPSLFDVGSLPEAFYEVPTVSSINMDVAQNSGLGSAFSATANSIVTPQSLAKSIQTQTTIQDLTTSQIKATKTRKVGATKATEYGKGKKYSGYISGVGSFANGVLVSMGNIADAMSGTAKSTVTSSSLVKSVQTQSNIQSLTTGQIKSPKLPSKLNTALSNLKNKRGGFI